MGTYLRKSRLVQLYKDLRREKIGNKIEKKQISPNVKSSCQLPNIQSIFNMKIELGSRSI